MLQGKSLNSLWKSCLAITAFGFGVQIIPLVGIISHLLLTPYWPVVFLNAAFVMMAVDALWGSKNRKLLVAPILWFGGYAAVAIVSHVQFYMLNRAADKMNQQSMLPLSTGMRAIRVVNGPTDSNYGSDLRAETLIQEYNVDEVFDGKNRSVRLSHQPCPERGISTSNGVMYSHISRGGGLSNSPHQFAIGICMVSGTAMPPSDIASVTAQEIEVRQGLIKGRVQDFEIAIPGRAPFSIRSVTASPLPWIPLPVAGCHFLGGFGDRWDSGCHAYFDHLSWVRNSEASPLSVVTRTLGMKAATIAERLPNLTWADLDKRPNRR